MVTPTRSRLRFRTRRSPERPVGPPALGRDERQALLACARAALAAATGLRPPSTLAQVLEATVGLDGPAPAFVTLTEDGFLRGCMGSLDTDRPVRDSVVRAAILAALDDPRFAPVKADELADINVTVSVLGPPRSLASPDAFRPGIDGVIVERGPRVALLLPEVATEPGWDAHAMLDAVCRKAGLPGDAWADRETRVSTFETVRFDGAAVEDDTGNGTAPMAVLPDTD
jgi:AmmeMemoRadiSam system protein A